MMAASPDYLLKQVEKLLREVQEREQAREHHSWILFYDPETRERVAGCDEATARLRMPYCNRDERQANKP